MKRVLIISPYFLPSNAADMQRIRASLPYFKQYGWEAVIVCVDEKYSDVVKDDLLLASVPAAQVIYKTDALPKKWTQKFGFGSLGFRSIWFYRKKVNEILTTEKFDLIYFSTTQFPVCVLGPYWKNKFNIPYIIDMQDPWYSDYYKSKPKNERPPKYRLTYGLHKILEAKAMKEVDGLISVSDYYIADLKARYKELKDVPVSTITFGAFEPDLKIAADNNERFKSLLDPGFRNIVYIGRGGADMHKAVIPVFKALKKGLIEQPHLFKKFKFYFIGTSYAPAGEGKQTILPLAKHYGVESVVVEITDRISYYHTLLTLQQADALFIPGSDDPKYSASKIYPYLLTKKPLLAVFNEKSNAAGILKECAANAVVLTFTDETEPLADALYKVFTNWACNQFTPIALTPNFDRYSAKNLTKKQTDLFAKAIIHYETKNTNA